MKLDCTYCKTEIQSEKLWYDKDRKEPYCGDFCLIADSAINSKIIAAHIINRKDVLEMLKSKKGKLEKKLE